MDRPAPVRALAALALAATIALTGCSGGAADGPDLAADGAAGGPHSVPGGEDVAAGGAAACVAGLTYDGAFYLQVEGGPVEVGEPLDGAEVPPCDDTGGDPGEATPIDAAAIEGVDPGYAVVAETGAGPMVYVSRDHAPGLSDADPLPAEVAEVLGLG